MDPVSLNGQGGPSAFSAREVVQSPSDGDLGLDNRLTGTRNLDLYARDRFDPPSKTKGTTTRRVDTVPQQGGLEGLAEDKN